MHILNKNKRMLKHDNIPNVSTRFFSYASFIWLQGSCAMQFHHNLIIAIGG